MKSVLMSIKPKYVEKILYSSKIYELRKRFPEGFQGNVYIYSSSPVQKVVGVMRIEDVYKSNNPEEIWEITTNNGTEIDNVGISKKEFDDYFRTAKECSALKIQSIEVFDKPKSLKNFDIERAPQSWCYINEDI